jgi:sorbitol-specific phosphotransferase system component IIA
MDFLCDSDIVKIGSESFLPENYVDNLIVLFAWSVPEELRIDQELQ